MEPAASSRSEDASGDFAARAAHVFAEMDAGKTGAISYVELRNWIGKKMREDEDLAAKTISDEMRKASLAAFQQHKRVSDDRLIDDSLGVEEVAALLQAMHLTAKAASDAAPEQVEIVDVMKYVPTQPAAGVQAEAAPELEAEPEPELEAEPEADPEPEPDPDPEPEPEPEAEAEAEPEPEPEAGIMESAVLVPEDDDDGV